MAYVSVPEGNQYFMEGHPGSRKHQYLFRGSLFSWIPSPENPLRYTFSWKIIAFRRILSVFVPFLENCLGESHLTSPWPWTISMPSLNHSNGLSSLGWNDANLQKRCESVGMMGGGSCNLGKSWNTPPLTHQQPATNNQRPTTTNSQQQLRFTTNSTSYSGDNEYNDNLPPHLPCFSQAQLGRGAAEPTLPRSTHRPRTPKPLNLGIL